jgi:NAD(P)-dependent dehydrogenase (short-subunit alcohol dehydrogenase family)
VLKLNSKHSRAGAIALGIIGGAAALRAAVRARRRMDFKNRVVLITGASRGLGLVLARQFAEEGAKLAICARDAEELERARQQLVGLGADVIAITCDVSREQDVAELVRAVESLYGRIDVLVNNAGVISVGPLESITPDDVRRSIDVHLWGPVYSCLQVLPIMKRQRFGRIVNISSIGGKISVPHLLPYSAGKFALVGWSEGLRAEVKKDGVLVTTICPGLMRTGSPPKADFKSKNDLEYAWFAISDSWPGISISAENAARKIIEAARFGEAEAVLSLPAKLAVYAHALAPGIFSEAMALVNRLLPGYGGIGKATATGRESESAATRALVTPMAREAERRNNEAA